VIAADLALALDPVLLAERVGIAPDAWQRDLLRATARRMLVNVTRQGGKSSIAAVLAVHVAIYNPGSLVLLVSPSLRQSGELFLKCISTYRAAGRPVPSTAETLLRLELSNGSRIISLPGSETTTRGFSAPALVILDEAARISDDLMMAITPMLATAPNARLILLSTPNGKQGAFWRYWSEGGDDWQRVEVPASAVPRISPRFLEEERRSMPSAWFRQEYESSFEQAEDAVFRYEDVRAAFSDDVQPLFGGAAP